MKEHVQKPGVRKWAGEDLIELQGESLTAIQALVEPYAPCIVQGCEVSHTDGVYRVQPGIVALKGSNEDGNACTKIVRFAGYTGEVLPIYLTIKVTPYMRVYADEENKPIAYEYTAEASTTPSAVPYLMIGASGAERLVDTIGITQKLDRDGGNASNVKVVSFVSDTAKDRVNLEAGSSLKELFGKIRRWFNDLGKLAFKSTVGTSDFDDALTTAFNNKVDKDGEKVLSECDFSQVYKDKLDGIAKNAEVNVQADWDETKTDSDAFIKNKPGNATAQKAGFMSKDDKEKLDSLEIGLDGFSIYRTTMSRTTGITYAGLSITKYFGDNLELLGGRTLQVGDFMIEASVNSYMYKITAVAATTFDCERVCSLRGATGAQGAKGDTGATGATGSQGPTGPQGPQGAEGLGIWRSSTATTNTTSSITLSSITIPTGRSVKVGDLIIANSTYSYLYRVTAVSSTTATVTYLTSLRGAQGAQGAAGTNATTTAVATPNAAGLMSSADKRKEDGFNPIISTDINDTVSDMDERGGKRTSSEPILCMMTNFIGTTYPYGLCLIGLTQSSVTLTNCSPSALASNKILKSKDGFYINFVTLKGMWPYNKGVKLTRSGYTSFSRGATICFDFTDNDIDAQIPKLNLSSLAPTCLLFPTATTSAAGFMSAADKRKLDTMQNPIPVGVYFLGSGGLRHGHGKDIKVNLNTTTKIYTIQILNGEGAYTFLPLSYNGNTIVFNNDYINSGNNYKIDCYIRTLDNSSKITVDTGFVMFQLS